MGGRLPEGVRRLFRLPASRSEIARDVDDEIRFHIAMREERLREGGLSADAARAEAQRRFGDADAIAGEVKRIDAGIVRERQRVEFFGNTWSEAGHSVRTLARSPGYTIAAVLTLALGIGANTAVFSVVNGVLLRPLPYFESARIQILHTRYSGLGFERSPVSGAEVVDVTTRTNAFESVGAYTSFPATVTGSCGSVACAPERVRGQAFTPSVFAVLREQPALGRVFVAGEGVRGRDAVVVLDNGFWRRRFGGDPGVVGKAIAIDGVQRVVLGVMPREFKFLKADIFVPLTFAMDSLERHRGRHDYIGIARLARNATEARARAQIAMLTARLVHEHPNNYPQQMGFALGVQSLQAWRVGDTRKSLFVLLGAVTLVLLIACVNVANLSLARAESRHREIAIRAALGASRLRLITQVMTEALLLSTAGSALGVLVAAGGLKALLSAYPGALPSIDSVRVDGMVLLATLGVAVFTAALFGLLPALQATRTGLQTDLREAGRGLSASLSRQRTRRLLITAEIALALIVLSAGALVIRSFWRLERVPLGFETERVIAMEVSIPEASYRDSVSVGRFYTQLTERMESLPEVSAAAAAYMLPTNGSSNWDIEIEGRPRAPGEAAPSPVVQVATPDYFKTLRIPLRSGRLLDARDDGRNGIAVVVNETMAKQLWPDGALGRRFRYTAPPGSEPPWFTIVGIVGDAHMAGPSAVPRAEWMMTHATMTHTGGNIRNMWLLVRTTGDATRVVPAARRELWALDRNLNFDGVQTMRAVMADAVAKPRFTMLLLACFAVIALALAAIGVYGVVSYTVAQRTREFGVRMAIGATPRDVLQLVIGQGLQVALYGVLIGVVGALFAARLLQGILFETRARDPLTLAGIAVLLVSVALIASYLPARRATRVDPSVTLRAS